MILKKVIIKTNTEGSDIVSSILLNNGCNGTTIVDKNDVTMTARTPKEATELTKYYPESVLVVGVIETIDADVAIKNITNELNNLYKTSPNFGDLTFRTEEVNSEHWTDIWQDYYKAYIVGKIKICGTWQKQSKSLFKIPILLNPGAAFGTGQHPTTELVIRAMQKLNLKNKTVMDVGAGSGILGICALKLGAKFAYLIDIDDVAIDASELNSKTNNVQDKVTVIKKDIIYTEDTTLKADILLVNISNEINLDFAKNVNNHVNENGIVILSGILPEYKNKIIEAYGNKGYDIISELTLDNWITYVLRKK